MSPTTSSEPHASTSGEAHQLVSLVTVHDRPPDQPEMDLPSTRPRSNTRTRRWHRRNITALFMTICRFHKRERPLGAGPDVRQSITVIFKYSWLNVLLIFMPLSWIFHYVKLNDTLVFVCSFLAIVPLANLLDFATEDLSQRFGETVANLFAFTLDNTVELTVAIIALVKCELAVVQSSLVGSLLSNLLLVLGTCFFVGGTRFSEQGFGISAVHQYSSLLTLTVIAVLLPAVFQRSHNIVQSTGGTNPLTSKQDVHDILSISHSAAVILLFIYLCYLVFQLFTHKNLYDDDHSDVQQSVCYPSKIVKRLHIREPPASSLPPPTDGAMHPAQWDALLEAGWEEEEEEPKIHRATAIALHVILTVLIAVTAGFLVDSIGGLTSSGHISKGFVGLILLPMLGSAAKQANVVAVSAKDRLMLCLKVALGSSLQLALFVIPFIVTLGWIMRKPMTLLFDPFESVVLFFSVLAFNYAVQDGKSHWFKGMILICDYAIIAVIFWYYPVSDPAGLLATCK